MKWQYCLVYIEDTIIFSKSPDEHLEHLDNVISLLDEAGLSLKLKKCFFMKESIEYLGHIVLSLIHI